MEKKSILNLRNTKIAQLGFVFKDIEAQAKIMEDLYGMPKFSMRPPLEITGEYRGNQTKYSTKLALSRCFNVQIELIQWIEGDTIHKEFLEQNREGLHHISIIVEDLDSFIQKMANLNIHKIQEVYSGKKIHLAYFDTEMPLGFILEAQEIVKRKRKK